MKPRTAPHALDWLRTQPGFRDLATRADELARLQADLDACVPASGLVATALSGGTLLVTARNAAVAAKLRQFAPSLAAALSASGWKVIRIKVRPQRLGERPPAPAARAKKPIPESALAGLAALANETESSALRDALAGMVRRHRTGGSRG